MKFLYTITYPTSLDTLSNPSAGDTLENAVEGLDHDKQHSNANDAIEALEAKVGVNSSAVTTSHDYKLSEVTSTDKAVGKTATQTLTNKTLTSPILNLSSNATGDMYYRKSDGTLARLPIGTQGNILDVSAGGVPEWTANPGGADASTTSKGVVEEATSEEALAGTDTGGTGAKLFVTPSKLVGSVYDFAAKLASDFTVTNSSTLTAVTGFSFSVAANEIWQVEIYGGVTASDATGDIKYGLVASADCWNTAVPSSWYEATYFAATGTLTNVTPTAPSSNTEFATLISNGNNNIYPIRLRYFFNSLAGAATVSFRIANQAASAGRTSTLKAGAYMLARKLQ